MVRLLCPLCEGAFEAEFKVGSGAAMACPLCQQRMIPDPAAPRRRARVGVPRKWTKRRIIGESLAKLGAILLAICSLVTGGTVYNSMTRAREAPQDNPWTLFWFDQVTLVAAGIIGAGSECVRRLGRRIAAPTWREAVEADPRPPVLLLRSFSADERALWNVKGEMRAGYEGTHSYGVRAWQSVTFEEMISETISSLDKFGPLLAIGRPNEKLPPVGAARLWVGGDEWQAKVSEFLQNCGAVIFILGKMHGTTGLAWELTEVSKCVPKQKVIFLVPDVETSAIGEIWKGLRIRYPNIPDPNERVIAIGTGPDGTFRLVTPASQSRKTLTEYSQAIESLLIQISIEA